MADPDWEYIAETLRLDEVLAALGVDVTHIRNGNHWANCPMHDDRGSHFSINEDTLVGNCYHCGGFNLPTLAIRLLDLETDQYQTAWKKAIEWLLPFSDGDVPEGDDQAFLEQLVKILARADVKEKKTRGEALPLFSPRLLEGLLPVPDDLLDKWKITDPTTMSEFKIGYDPERERGEYVGPAIVIPHFFKTQFVGYQERWLNYGTEGFPRWIPKYTNSNDFPKKETLYNFDRACQDGGWVIVVESALSVVRLWELGYPAVCTFGAGVSHDQYRLLRTFERGVYLAFDNDEKGRRTRGQVARKLSEVPVYGVPFPDQKKANIADLPEAEVFDLVARAKPLLVA